MPDMDCIELGSAPYGEECVQFGTDDYRAKAREECGRYIDLLCKLFPAVKADAFRIKWFPYEGGSYAEVVVMFDHHDEISVNDALYVEANLPEMWES